MAKKLVNQSPIGIIYAGGTFGSYGHPLASLSPDVFLPILRTILTEHFATYPNHADLPVSWQLIDNPIVKDSSQLTPRDFADFYRLLLASIGLGIRQFVILTGTDTLSYLSAFLAEAFANSNVCILVTGAMQPLLDSTILTDYIVNPASDATQNLFEACKLARHGEAGVRVCFAGENWPAQTVQKIHSHDMMAFVGHHRAGYPANSYSNKVTPNQSQHWLADKLLTMDESCDKIANARIATIYLTPMLPEQLTSQLSQFIESQVDAIILLGFGSGNIPFSPSIEQVLLKAKRQGCLVVISTQCPYGGVSDTYEAGAWLSKCCVLSSGRLTLPAIHARLLWLISQYDTATRRRQRWSHCLKDTHTVA